MAKTLIQYASLVLLLTIVSFPLKAKGQCGYSNCTNYFGTCSTPTEPARCICVPLGGVKGTCIYQGLLKENLSYCSSHSDCVRNGQGDFCLKPSGIDFGWCLSRNHADSLKLPA